MVCSEAMIDTEPEPLKICCWGLASGAMKIVSVAPGAIESTAPGDITS